MGWVHEVPFMHEEYACIKPNTEGVGEGSIWECDSCRRHWRYDGRRPNPDYNSHPSEPYYTAIWKVVPSTGKRSNNIQSYTEFLDR